MTSSVLRPAAAASAALISLGTLCLCTGDALAHSATPQTVATSTPSTKAGTQKFTFITAGTELRGKPSPQVGLFHGAINDGGKDVPHAQSDLAHLHGGSITVKHPDSESTFVPKIDKSTCYLTFKITGHFTLEHGTGRYQGITGAGTFTGHGYGYLTRKQDGSCNMNAQPKSEVFEVTGHGSLG